MFFSCNGRSNNQVNTKVASTQVDCKCKLLTFADTLSLDTNQLLNNYLNERHFNIKKCHLEKFRNNLDVQTSILLVMFKINDYYLRSGYKDALALPIKSISQSSFKLIEEFTYMVYKKDIPFPENLRTSDVKKIVLRDPRFLKNNKIKYLFDSSLKLERRAKKRFIY